MTLSAKQRDSIYLAVFLINGILAACVQQSLLPSSYAHWAALASLILTALMKQFGAKDPALPAPQESK